jgi:predicted nuclease of predicted toxin-antitoxin system
VIVVIDNCLPVSWVAFLEAAGFRAQHWRQLGAPNAPDAEILHWAFQNEAVVLTQDLDFTKLLFQSRAHFPSVIQLRLDDVRPANIGGDVVRVLQQQRDALNQGALITLRGGNSRPRLLPLGE